MMPFGIGTAGDTTNQKKSKSSATGIDHAASAAGTLLFGPLGSVLGMPKENPTETDEKDNSSP